MNTSLANRLPTYVLHDLVKACPQTLEPLTDWMDQCGFWLAELQQHPRTPDQVPFMVGLLGLAVSRQAGWPTHTACAELKNYLSLHLMRKEAV